MKDIKTSTCFMLTGLVGFPIAPYVAASATGVVFMCGLSFMYIIISCIYRLAEAIEKRDSQQPKHYIEFDSPYGDLYTARQKMYEDFYETKEFNDLYEVLYIDMLLGKPSGNTRLTEDEFNLVHNSVCAHTKPSLTDKHLIVNTYKDINFITTIGQGSVLWAELTSKG